MRKILLLLTLMTCWFGVSAQIIEGPQFVCPNASTYTFNFSHRLACDQYKWSVTGGSENSDYEIVNGKTDWKIQIKFYNNVTLKLILEVTNDGTYNGSADASCVTANNGQKFELMVQSAYGNPVTPIRQSRDAKCGRTDAITFEVDPHHGARYNWTNPSGWTTQTSDFNKITVLPNGKNGGKVSVDVFFDADWLYYQECVDNYTPEYHHPLVSKNVPLVIPSLSAASGPSSLAIGDQTPITYTAKPTISEAVYYWEIPCGWTGPNGATGSFTTTSPSITVVPSGYRVGSVSVKAGLQCSGSLTYTNKVSQAVSFSGLKPVVFSIFGGGTVCYDKTSTFKLTRMPAPGSKITWTKSSNLAYVSGQGSQYYAVKAASSSTRGSGWVKVTVSDDCGEFPTITKTLWVGPPDQAHKSELYVQGFRGINPITLTTGAAYVFQLDPVKGATSYRWVLPRGFSFMEGFGTNSYVVKVWTSSVGGQYQIKCYPQNGCGSSGSGYQSLTINLPGGTGGGGGGDPICPKPPCQIPQPIRTASAAELPSDQPVEFKVFPNPAENYVNVELPYLVGSKDNTAEAIVRVYDQMRREVLQHKFHYMDNTLKLNVADLPCGIYVLSVSRGSESYTEKIYIK